MKVFISSRIFAIATVIIKFKCNPRGEITLSSGRQGKVTSPCIVIDKSAVGKLTMKQMVEKTKQNVNFN